MKFRRIYSAPGDPYAGLTFEPRASRIVNPDGSVIFEAPDIMVPTGWSQVPDPNVRVVIGGIDDGAV